DRCGATRLLGSVDSGYGRNVRVPRAGRNQVVFARIHGAGISGLERLRTLLYRSTFRNVVVNGGAAGYRLVPGTAADGLIMSAPRSVDFPVPYRLSPDVRTLELTGASGSLRFDFYAMPVRPLPRQVPVAAG